MPDISIVVADAGRMAAIRDGLQLPGRVMYFNSSSLATVVESIRAYRPKAVAIDAMFAQTSSGASFADRIEAMAIAGLSLSLIVEHQGRWTTTARKPSPIVAGSKLQVAGGLPNRANSAPTVASLASALASASQIPGLNTRRAPRFMVRNSLEAVVESGRATVVDMSVLGAQIVSLPKLRPNQKIKLGLPDTDDVLNLVAQVAWSTFEQPSRDAAPHYRAGIEFTDAAQQALDDYRRRYCTDQPIPLRGR